MDVAEDTFGVFVFILCLVDYRIKENHERPSGREDLPSLLLGGLFGNGVEDNFNWLAHDLLHFGDDVGVPICVAPSAFTSASLCNEAVVMIGENPDNFASWIAAQIRERTDLKKDSIS